MAIVLAALAESSTGGLRLTDVIGATGLRKATAHRLLVGLAEQDEASGRFFLGLKILSWAAAAADRFGLAKLVEPSLARLCQSTQDTVYLTMLAGDVAICLARHEGAFPIKALTLKVGDQHLLASGAGSLALLSALRRPEADKIIGRDAPITGDPRQALGRSRARAAGIGLDSFSTCLHALIVLTNRRPAVLVGHDIHP